MSALLAMLVAASALCGDIRPLLREEGFDAPINGREQITYVGHIAGGGNDYQIYVYRGLFRAASVDHGVNRLIVILNGAVFFGQYAIPMPTDCKVRGRSVICASESPGVIEFTEQGPPHEIWFDGEVIPFTTGSVRR